MCVYAYILKISLYKNKSLVSKEDLDKLLPAH